MSTVTLTIGPKSYPIACADGEEAHIEALGAVVAEKYAQLGNARAPLEAQNMLFAALFMADELAEARRQVAAVAPEYIAELETRVAALEAERSGAESEIARLSTALAKSEAARAQSDLFAADTTQASADELADHLEALAERAEAIADTLEAGAANA